MFYRQMLINPLEEEFNLPTFPVNLSKGFCKSSHVIGDESNGFKYRAIKKSGTFKIYTKTPALHILLNLY
jgi:hypothetical protein